MCVRRARTHARSLHMAAHVRNATRRSANPPHVVRAEKEVVKVFFFLYI